MAGWVHGQVDRYRWRCSDKPYPTRTLVEMKAELHLTG